VLVCTHATFRFAVDRFGVEAFDDRLIAVDEFHHVSANPDNKLGDHIRQFIARDKTHIVAMTGSYFRGDAEAVVRNPIRTTLFASNRPLIKLRKPTAKVGKFIARDIPEWLLFSLPKLEWMKLLAVPLAITLAGSVISRQVQREANQNSALKAYFDQLEKLTFDRELLADKPNTGAIPLARGRTVAALRELDHERRKQLMEFLLASEFASIKKASKEPAISFSGQDLSKLDLHGISLSIADLSGANLSGANLSGANLSGANLSGANLEDTNFEDANLSGANLKGAILRDANLSYANLEAANLEGALLRDANLEGANLESANLCRTILPKDTNLDPNRDCEKLGIDPQTGEYIP
jgi:uncharacterized protein YjbI with pentapeptide repeats